MTLGLLGVEDENTHAAYQKPDSVSPSESMKTPSHVKDGSSSGIDKKALLRRIDLHVLPILVVIYLFAFLDRVNIGNASVFGMATELKLVGNQYNVALCIFFIPYIVFEIPSNLVLKKFPPHIFLSFCIFMFGAITVAQGFVKNYTHLLVTRFLLGFFETGIFPGAFYLLSMWYPRHASQKRFTFFFLSTALAGAFGGLLAYGIGNIEARGLSPWRWIFILEGIMTCVVGVVSYWACPDFPEDVKWVNDEEREFIRKRLAKDVGEAQKDEKIRLRDLSVIFTDYKFMSAALLYCFMLVPMYSFAYFTPTIINGWGIKPIETQLRTVPIWFFAWLVAMAAAYLSDRRQQRFYFVLGPVIVGIVGFIILLALPDAQNPKSYTGVKYFALFVLQAGIFSATPIVVCWFTTNLRTHKQRAIGSAFQIAFGNLGGILATFIFQKHHAPAYRLGYSICTGALGLAIVTAIALWIGMGWENKKFDKAEQESVGGEQGADEQKKKFRYIR
ncbi:MFS transporter [Ascobolus immersus RN42]|uniref:MFS transporter n=1 Tax=Ascobolus immersus RN42 TaxID=1160509 RepID=A0A3N4IUD5_ASCIM|nr:MFS transporter [Ascobolus immersus RN42]